MSDYKQHEESLMKHFAEVLKADAIISEAKTAKRDAEAKAMFAINGAEKRAADAWAAIESLMKETGEIEVILPDDHIDYKISYTTPRQSVKVDEAAVPDEFVRIERKPKLKEIGDYLKTLDTPPNWASFEQGKPKLTYKAVKKGK